MISVWYLLDLLHEMNNDGATEVPECVKMLSVTDTAVVI